MGKRNQGSQNGHDATPPGKSPFQRGGVPYASHSHDPPRSSAHQTPYYQDRSRYAHQTPPLGIYGQYPQYQAMNRAPYSYGTNYGHVYGYSDFSPSGSRALFSVKGRENRASMSSYNQDYPDQRERFLVDNDNKDESEEGSEDGEAVDKAGKYSSLRTDKAREIVDLSVPSLFPNMKAPPKIEGSFLSGVDLSFKVESVAKAAYEEILATGKEVTLWKVVQTMLASLKVSSLEYLGVNLHDVPCLKKLMLLEGKVNAFIHCHVAVRRVTTLHDLEQELCQSEGVEDFSQLGLGPLLVHPLVVHYFDPPVLTEVYNITSEDIMHDLSVFAKKSQGQMLQVENFLSFMTKKRSLASPKHLCVRIQSFGMYVSSIRQENKADTEFSKRHLSIIRARTRAESEAAAAPAQSQLPGIINRVEDFLASTTSNQHASRILRNLDVSSDDEDKDRKSRSGSGSTGKFHASRCPYPSAAEEQARLVQEIPPDLKRLLAEPDFTLSKQELKDFIGTWKDVCHTNSILEVFTRMLNVSGSEKGQMISKKKKRQQAKLFKTYPAIGLLNVAVMSMRIGHWDSMYDALTDATVENLQQAMEMPSGVIDVGSAPKSMAIIKDKGPNSGQVLEDLLNLISEANIGNHTSGGSKEKHLSLWVRRLLKSEYLLAQKYDVSSFPSLKLGNFSDFVEQHWEELFDQRMLDSSEENSTNCGITALPDHHLDAFICQVALALKDDENLCEEALMRLIIRQFNIHHGENLGHRASDKLAKFLDYKKKGKIVKKSVSFAAALIGTDQISHERRTSNLMMQTKEEDGEDNTNYRVGQLGMMENSDAIESFQKMPLLYDLAKWSHWDLVFAPTLGPLLDWLESYGGLECIVTCEGGGIIRINGSVSVDDFLSAILKERYEEVAISIVSLVAKYGGVRHAPVALLKSHAEKGLKILAMNTYDGFDDNMLEKKRKLRMFESDAKDGLASWKAVKLVLCSLMQVPLDFQAFAGVVFVPALSSIVPDAHIALLKACTTVDERNVLHKIGMLVGISEWIDDFGLLLKESSSGILNSKVVGIEGNSPVVLDKNRVTSENSIKYDDSDQVDVTNKDDRPQKKKRVDISCRTNHIHDEGMHDDVREQEHHSHALGGSGWMLMDSISKQEENEARDVIDRIRQEEFGLDLDLEGKEGRLLSKQHARIGRALQCLSRELYSQDSHFVLELVQNADDNQYKFGVEAGLVFVIQRNRIVVMNNEIGFTAANMKALCDVGNSTKVGSAAGYIGHKGIGFKSVFRVTDAPEIHSRGFHVKFDISEGNLGFILPTLVPPVTDTRSISETLSAVDEKVVGMEKSRWATCLILPLKPSVAGGPEFELLASKFNDIRPSLLLFLHRLRCIAIRNDASDALRVMRRLDLENGLVQVENGDSTATWLVVSLKLKAAAQRQGVETTEIALAFPLHEVEGGYKACCEQQYVFSFLPLRPYGLKFIIQGDFILPSSREEVDSDSAWNQWLISEIPKACMEAVFAFRKLEYFQNNPGKAATALMSYMPLEGEVQGFFSPLPRMLLSVLRTTECLPCEDANGSWNLPCALVEGWNDFVRKLIPDSLLKEHLGLMYLHKDVKLNSFLAASLGVHNFGASILVDLMRSLCNKKGALAALGPTWVGCWLVALYRSTQSSKEKGYLASNRRKTDDIYKELQSLAFIPLANGTLTSIADGPIWLPSGIEEPGRETKALLEKFPLIYSELRIIHPSLLALVELEDFKSTLEAGEGVATALEFHSLVCTMLQRIGVGQVLAHDIMYSHILPSMGSNSCLEKDRGTLLQYLSFIIFHLRSDCRDCNLSRSALIKQFQEKLLLSTNNGYKRVGNEPLHFCVEFGCPVQAKQIIQGTEVKWNEVDSAYLEIVQDGSKDTLLSWRMFLKELGVTDFVQLVQVKRRGCENIEVDDWESPELIKLLEGLSHENIQIQQRVNQCALLLLALDKLWEECYSCCQVTVDSDNQEMVSSFMLTLRRFRWVLSSLDGELHCPTELFHHCYAVESIFGCHAPYASPQVQSKGLVSALGLRTHVTTQDALAVLRSWTQQGCSFKASVGQMMRLYSFIWSQVTSDQEEILQFFKSGSFIFLPTILKSKNPEEISEGSFFMLDEVYWEDETGCVDFVMKSKQHTKELITSTPFRTLKLVYPSMHGFFVDVLGIRESLCFSEHIMLLKSLAGMSSPRESWKQAMNILKKWSREIQAHDVNSEEVSKWKELLQDAKNTVLPTLQDKWVALDSSMALICWCDDDDLGKQFLNTGRIYFVLNGCIDLLIAQKGAKGTGFLNCPDISAFLKAMNIPPLSEVVDREPIVYGAESSSQFQELLKWVLPYVQRFLRHFYAEDYKCLQKTLFSNGFKYLRCIVADEIYFRYKLPGSLALGSKRIKCDYLLQGHTFYVTGLENMNAMFLEFSRLFFHGKTNLQLANFLHLITLSAHSGSEESEVEVLVSGSQGIPPLPLSANPDDDEEPCWRMEPIDASQQQSDSKHHMEKKKVILSDDPISKKAPKRFANSVWPPQSWHTAPGMPPPRNKVKGGSWPLMVSAVDSHLESAIVKVSSSRGNTLFLDISETNQQGEHMGCKDFFSERTSGNVGGEVDERDQLQLGQPSEQRQELTGRLGEALVFRYLLQKYGAENVTWLNETVESGCSFDFRVKKQDGQNVFIEVKATRSADKDWFEITKREWELATQEGENFVVIRVFIAPAYESARLLWLPDPVRLFEERIIKLAIVLPQLQSNSLAETLLMLDMSQA